MLIVIAISLAAGVSSALGARVVTPLVERRITTPLTTGQKRWVSAPALSIGGLAAGALWLLPVGPSLGITLVIAGVLAWWLLCIDVAIHRLPDPLVAGLGLVLLAGLATTYLFGQIDFTLLQRAILGGGAGFALFFVLSLLGRKSLGFGDVKLAAPLGMVATWPGWDGFGQWVLLSFILGGVFAAFFLVTGRMSPKDSLAFGPWMIVAAFIILVMNTSAGVTH